MAYKKYKNTDKEGLTAEDRALEKFADVMIEKIRDMDKADWKQPWFPAGVHPARNLDGREYNDFNQVMLMFLQQAMGWKTCRYATFDKIKFLNYERDSSGKLVRQKDKDGNDIPDVHVNSGEKSIPVFLGLKYAEHIETRKKIDFDDYKKLDKSEQEKYRLGTYFRVYNVFNLDQTSMKEDRPELYRKYASELEDKMPEKMSEANLPEMDALLDKGLWVCPITQVVGPDAYYRPSTDEIVLPSKELFFKDEQFYGTALHEMTHSTGAKNRTDRPMGGIFGSPEYAREELVAELSSALLCSKMGFSKDVESEIQTQSASYLKSWLGSLQDDTKYIKSVLSDVKRASSFIGDRLGLIGERLERDGEKAEFSDIIEEDRMKRDKLLHPETESADKAIRGESVTIRELYPYIDSRYADLEKHEVDMLASVASDILTGAHLVKPRSEGQKILHNEFVAALQAVDQEQDLTPRQAALLAAMSESFYGGMSDMAEQLSVDKEKLLHAMRGSGNAERHSIQGLEDYSELSILESVRHDIEERLEDVEGVELKGMAIHGSRKRGDARDDSDLDVVIEYSGDMPEDGLFNIINQDPIEVGGVRVDVNSIKAGKSGTLVEYMERSRQYDAEKTARSILECNTMNHERMQESLCSMPRVILSPLMQQYVDFKSKRPLLVPLFHIGDGYETYQDDARRISSVLGLTLQKSREPGPDGNPAVFVSFPDSDLEIHKKSLLDNSVPLALLEDMNSGKRNGFPKTTEQSEGIGQRLVQAQADEHRHGGIHR